jgi:two-component sensor histidine kinase
VSTVTRTATGRVDWTCGRLEGVSTLSDLVAEHTQLTGADIDHLHRLAGEWQLVSDLAFADLELWVRTKVGDFLCVAQCRPTTGPTAHAEDQVGRRVTEEEMPHLAVAEQEGRIWREGDPVWQDDAVQGEVPVRCEAVPVRRDGSGDRKVIAVLGHDTNLSAARVPSQLELVYLQTGGELCQMIADGTFPPHAQKGETTSAPRVGDGLIRLDATGVVTYASPNAQSAYRRLGVTSGLQGVRLGTLTAALADDPLDGRDAADRIAAALSGLAPPRKEVEAHGTCALLRALPLRPEGSPLGALVLIRDITEVRTRDRQLLSKDATIREIHHRVKNNLQTVAALLRLQARRVEAPEARTALVESVRRVSSIAMVHETLSMSPDETVAFDEIVDRVISMVAEVAAPEAKVTIRREGTFGVLGAELATPLAMVLTELMQNAVEHGFGQAEPGEPGTVLVRAHRWRQELHVSVADDGRGLPDGFRLEASDRLGLQIVRQLATGELDGTITLERRPAGGTIAEIVVPLVRKV